MRSTIVDSMARLLWATSWADHVEECGCQSLSGCNIYDVMPDPPEAADKLAEDWAGKIETAVGRSLDDFYALAMVADGRSPDDDSLGERFGECLAFAAMGAGVAWEDDHADLPAEIPYLGDEGTCDLMMLAGQTCDECNEARESWWTCAECGFFLAEDVCGQGAGVFVHVNARGEDCSHGRDMDASHTGVPVPEAAE